MRKSYSFSNGSTGNFLFATILGSVELGQDQLAGARHERLQLAPRSGQISRQLSETAGAGETSWATAASMSGSRRRILCTYESAQMLTASGEENTWMHQRCPPSTHWASEWQQYCVVRSPSLAQARVPASVAVFGPRRKTPMNV